MALIKFDTVDSEWHLLRNGKSKRPLTTQEIVAVSLALKQHNELLLSRIINFIIQAEQCEYECIAGPLENLQAFVDLKVAAGIFERIRNDSNSDF